MISSFALLLIIFGVGAVLITAALSPLETLTWWAGWSDQELAETPPSQDIGAAPQAAPDSNAHKKYVVYLSGVATISGKFLHPRERAFLRALNMRRDDVEIIDTIFPYSAAGIPMHSGQRMFEGLWRFLQKRKIRNRATILSSLINIRNVFQVMVSADHRYGPIYNQGIAKLIEETLIKRGYAPHSNAPIILVGYSGGAQIALGAALFLRANLGAPVHIISVGGVFASDPGFHAAQSFHHIVGEKDGTAKMGSVLFPERWGFFSHSAWNQARQHGRIKMVRPKNLGHMGAKRLFWPAAH